MERPNSYNGWTNYATWRIMLEIFDGYECDQKMDAESVEDFISEVVGIDGISNRYDSLKDSYAHSFISNANFHEIADAVNEYNESRCKEEGIDFIK